MTKNNTELDIIGFILCFLTGLLFGFLFRILEVSNYTIGATIIAMISGFMYTVYKHLRDIKKHLINIENKRK
jgi:hypothetical protein